MINTRFISPLPRYTHFVISEETPPRKSCRIEFLTGLIHHIFQLQKLVYKYGMKIIKLKSSLPRSSWWITDITKLLFIISAKYWWSHRSFCRYIHFAIISGKLLHAKTIMLNFLWPWYIYIILFNHKTDVSIIKIFFWVIQVPRCNAIR